MRWYWCYSHPLKFPWAVIQAQRITGECELTLLKQWNGMNRTILCLTTYALWECLWGFVFFIHSIILRFLVCDDDFDFDFFFFVAAHCLWLDESTSVSTNQFKKAFKCRCGLSALIMRNGVETLAPTKHERNPPQAKRPPRIHHGITRHEAMYCRIL